MEMVRSFTPWCLGLVLTIVPVLRAQSPAEPLVLSAEEKLQNGDPKGAIAIYEEVLSKYPTFEGAWTVRYNLGFAHYMTENFDKAIELFKGLAAEKNIDPGLKEQATLIQGGALAAKAARATETERGKLLERSVNAYNDFLKAYSSSKSVGDALYGKAAAQLQSGKLEDAEKTLAQFGRDAVSSTLKEEAAYLLARVYAAQAKVFREGNKDAEAKKKIEDAQRLFGQIGANTRDLVLANEAAYSAGEALANAGAPSEAIPYLRKVKSKRFMEEIQGKIVEDLRKDRNQAISAGSAPQAQAELNRRYERANSKLTAIRKGASLFLNAQQLIAKCYYDQNQYDEVLVLCRHYLPHFDPDQKKRAGYMIIKALLEKKEAEKAIQEYAKFKALFPNDKMGEAIPIGFSDYFSHEGRTEEAIRWADEYEAAYPNGTMLEQAYFLAANAATASGKTDEAEKRNKKFSAKFPNSSLAGAALFNQAYTNYLKKDYPAAISDFRMYVEKFPKSASAENAAFFIGTSLYEIKKYDEAIKELQEFEKKYAQSKLLCSALYQTAQAYDGKKDTIQANATYARVVKNCAKEDVAPFSQFAIIENLLSQGAKQQAQAAAAADEFVKLFPSHKLASAALLYKAGIFRNNAKIKEAQAVYEELIAKYPESPNAAEAQVSIGEMFFQEAVRMASRPDKLSPEKQAVWKENIQKSQNSYERALKDHPENPAVDKALSQMSLLWQARINAKFATPSEAKSCFENLASNQNALKIKIAFTLGSLLNLLGDQADALKVLEDAFQKAGDISLPNEGYKQYRALLLINKQYDQAMVVSDRQLKEKQAAGDEKGIAEAILGLGQASFEKGDVAKASEHFKEVMAKYPWHETAAPEAEFYQIWIEEKKGGFDGAIKGYNVLLPRVRDPELKVAVYMRLGHSFFGKSESAAAGKAENLKQAIGFFLRIGTTFGAYPSYAAEGLYTAASLYEKLAGAMPDAKSKTESNQNAVKFYKRCIQEYPSSPWSEKCKERLKAMGAA